MIWNIELWGRGFLIKRGSIAASVPSSFCLLCLDGFTFLRDELFWFSHREGRTFGLFSLDIEKRVALYTEIWVSFKENRDSSLSDRIAG